MSNISFEKLIETIITLLIVTIQAQVKKGKVSVEALLESLGSDEFKNQLKDLLKQGMPKQAGEKKLKDENAPKRPKSGYMFFAEKKRPEIKKDQPELKMVEISKVIGERWKSAVPATKEKYNKKSENDKLRYKEEMASYKRPSDEVLLTQKINQKKKRGKQASGDKKKRTKKPEGAPTRGKSAYLFFCQANRAEVKEANPSFKATEVMAELGRMWKELPDEEKVEFEEQAAEAKEKYLQEKTEWEEKTGLELSPKKPKSKDKPKKSKSEESEPESEESEPESPKSQSPKPESPKPKAKKQKPDPQSEESEPESPKPKTKKFGAEPVSPAPQKKASKKKAQVASSDEEDN
jgi:hypothetical protein